MKDIKHVISLYLILVLALALCACGQKADIALSNDTATWREHYDLGIRYLSEGNYEEAIIAFAAAIEIDPKQSDAYRKAAEAYEGLGDIDSAVAILQQGIDATGDQALMDLLKEKDTALEDQQASLEGVQLTLSLTDPNLRESYPINKSESGDDHLEYRWSVAFNDGTNFCEVGTSHFSDSGDEPRNATLYEMQSNVWLRMSEDSRSTHYSTIAIAELTIDGSTLSWTFTIPAEYNFDVEKMEVTGTKKVCCER